MGVMNRGGFSGLLAPGFRKILFDSYKERPLEYTRFVNKHTSKRAYEEDFNIGGLGALQPKTEGGSIVYQMGIPGNIKRYVWSTYALGYRITQEMFDDDLYGVFGTKFSRSLGRSARNNEEVVGHSPLNNAFNVGFNGYVTGEALLGDHIGLRGGTLRNTPIVQADFGLLTLQAAIEHFHSLTDESGFPIMLTPKKLIHSIGDYWMVNQVLKSQFLPGGALNDINQIEREGITPYLSHYLTDPDAWFLLADTHDINYFERRPFTYKNGDDFDTGDAKFKGTRRNGAGFGDWRGIYGSSGV